MTRKDYQLIAAALADVMSRTANMQTATEQNTAQAAIRAVGFELATALANADPKFDRERFLTACGAT